MPGTEGVSSPSSRSPRRFPLSILDAYASPLADDADRRAALVDQLGWLEHEAAVLAPLLDALPAWAVRQAPMPTDLSAAETFAAFAAYDRAVASAWLDAAVAGDGRDLATPDPLPLPAGAADAPLADLLADVQAARADLRARLGSLPAEAWDAPFSVDGVPTTLAAALLGLCRRDADALRALAYRLHEADLRS